MAIQKNTTNGVLTRYEAHYRKGADVTRIYDQLAGFMKETLEPRGTTIQASMLGDMIPRPSTAVGSMDSDFVPQTIDDSVASITVDFYNDGLKSHQKVDLTQFDSMSAKFAEKVGMNMMETVDALARRAATEGSIVLYPGTHTSRVTLIGTTSTDILTDVTFDNAAVIQDKLETNKYVDGTMVAIFDPFVYTDFVKTTSHFVTAATYTEWGKKLLLDNEIGMYNGFRIVKHPRAKTLWGAGAANATAYSDVLSIATKVGAKTLTPTTNTTNIAVGQWITIGTPQSGAESDANLRCEGALVVAKDSTTITVAGNGPLGGLRFPHDAGEALSNAWSVHPVVIGGPSSLAKAVSKELGEYGELVKPFQSGNAKQWTNWSWKWFGGYGRLAESYLARIESASTRC